MADFPTTESCQVLSELMATQDPVAAEVLLVCLVESVIEPAATHFVRGRFRIAVNNNNDLALNQDALDIVSEVKVAMISILKRMKSSPDLTQIDSLEGYTVTVARNTYSEYLRKKCPNRFRLRNQIRYIIAKTDGLQMSSDNGAGAFCGMVDDFGENGQPELLPIPADRSTSDLQRVLLRLGKDPNRIGLGELVAFILREIGRPIAFDDFVNVIGELRGLKEPAAVELTDDVRQNSNVTDPIGTIDRKAFLRAVLDELADMPLRHRRALLLHFTDDHDDNLLMMFVFDGVASVRELAGLTELPADDFAAMWNRLPLADNEIAELMGLERQQVINLRQSARRSLRSRLSNRGFFGKG